MIEEAVLCILNSLLVQIELVLEVQPNKNLLLKTILNFEDRCDFTRSKERVCFELYFNVLIEKV